MSWKRIIAVVLPFTVLVFNLVTAKAIVACVDGPDEARFGFPLFWMKPGPTSLSREIDLAALLIDALAYFFICLLLWLLIEKLRPLAKRARLVSALLWAAALALLSFQILLLAVGDTYTARFGFNGSSACSVALKYAVSLSPPLGR